MKVVFAYLDPGSGSVILQAILGGVAAIAVTAKLWWARLLTFLRIRKPAEDVPQTEPAIDDESSSK